MAGLIFQRSLPVVPSDPRRADVACFVGFVGRRGGDAAPPLPAEILRWLAERSAGSSVDEAALRPLVDVAVPVDTWDVFDALFAWERRPIGGSGHGIAEASTYLGAAVRSFFAQGGRKCYVVRVGDPPPYLAPRAERLPLLARLLPGHPTGMTASAADRASWRGIGQLFGLPDVSFVCLPDLADLVKADPPDPDFEAPAVPPLPEVFVECSEPVAAPLAVGAARRLEAPRCDEEGFGHWARALRLATELLARQQREVQVLAAVPLPLEGEGAPPLPRLVTAGRLDRAFLDDAGSLASAFLQLAYPWLRTAGSANLPQELESPDGVLAGLLARNALARGAFRSAAGLGINPGVARAAQVGGDGRGEGDARAVYPVLSREQRLRLHPPAAARAWSLEERVSLFGPTPRGLELLTDVTASLDGAYRPAAVQRLVSSLVRAARRIGEDAAFGTAGERLWSRIRQRLEDVLQNLWEAGALRGASAGEAYQVRCDRSTMSQNDLDNGRVVAEVRFEAAIPVNSIRVVLSLDEGGRVSLSTVTGSEEAA